MNDTISYDNMFKYIFSSNEKLLKELISVSINKKIEGNIIPINVEIYGKNKSENIKRADMFFSIDNKIFIDIEVNKTKSEFIMNRNFTYINELFRKYYVKDRKREFYLINLNDFKNKEYEEENYVLGKNEGRKLIKNYTILNIDLERYKKAYYNGNVTKKTAIFSMLIEKDKKKIEEMLKIIIDEKGREKIMSEIKRYEDEGILDLTECTQSWIDAEKNESMRIGEKKGISEGIKEGIKKEKDNIIKSMLNHNLNINTIASIVDRPVSYIEKFK